MPDLHSAAVVVDVTPVEAGPGFAGTFQSLKLNHCLEDDKIHWRKIKILLSSHKMIINKQRT